MTTYELIASIIITYSELIELKADLNEPLSLDDYHAYLSSIEYSYLAKEINQAEKDCLLRSLERVRERLSQLSASPSFMPGQG